MGEEVEVLTSQVQQYIELYSHVRITDEKYTDLTGFVVSKSDNEVVVTTGDGNQEIILRPWQIQETAHEFTGQKALEDYESGIWFEYWMGG